jgi:periplasmic mercuric ion binding protein
MDCIVKEKTMNKRPWLVLISFALLAAGSFFIFFSADNVSARSLSTSSKQVAATPEYHATLETVTFDVPSMTCASCPFIVKKTLQSVPGVTEATADFDTKTAMVVFDKEKTNISVLLEALKNRGYPSKVANENM